MDYYRRVDADDARTTRSPQALLLATAAAQDLSDVLARRLQLNPDDDFGRTCTKETEAVLACHQKTCPDVTFDGRAVPWLNPGDGCSVPGCDMSTCDGIKACQEIQCDLYGSWTSMDDLIRQCCDATECSDYGTGACGDELMAFAECGVTAAAEQFCGVSNCIIPFPIDKGFCDTDCWQQCGDGSDGAAATGLGFLTTAAAVVAAL